MRERLGNLLAILLLIPAMMGWCCHSAMECRHCDHVSHASHPEATHEHHCGETHHGQPSHAPCKSCGECKGICTFLPTSKLRLDVPARGVALYFVPADLSRLACDGLTP